MKDKQGVNDRQEVNLHDHEVVVVCIIERMVVSGGHGPDGRNLS